MKSALMALLLAAPLAAAQDPKRDEAEAKLKNVKVTLDFKDTPIDSVLDYLREISGLNIFLDGKVREKNIVVTLKVSELTLRSVLNLILKPQGCDTLWREGVVMVMTKEDVVDKTIKMQIYDCRDILYPIRDFPGVEIDLSQTGIGVVTTSGDITDAPEVPIEELVKAHTGGRTWDDSKCTCRLSNGLLVVKNTPEVHKQVVRLLDMLRSNK